MVKITFYLRFILMATICSIFHNMKMVIKIISPSRAIILYERIIPLFSGIAIPETA